MNSHLFTLYTSLIAFIAAAIACLIAYFKGRVDERRDIVQKFNLSRHDSNPAIEPSRHLDWEMNGTFNPAAIADEGGIVHLIYRAIGGDGVSRLGYAYSPNGKAFTRTGYPVFNPEGSANEVNPTEFGNHMKQFDPTVFTSGGSWSGCEDPRLVKIGDKVYMTYVAFEGWDSVRIALTSIKMKDLRQGKWNWRRPRLISKKGEVNKNWLIFPEKINGKYAILHSIVPKPAVEYVDSLDLMNKPISSPRPGGPQPGRKAFWDNKVRGAGPPPIKTDKGWLLLYHAHDKDDPWKHDIGYRIGAMILDLNDPTKVLYRSPAPILNPEMHYENHSKHGVVYASGAVVLNGNLIVYYGGGDRHVCIAETPLSTLLDWLVKYGKV